MPAKIEDVARQAGVSTATVSRVLSGKPYVSDELRERVKGAVQDLNYRPSRVARSLRVQRSSIIGLIISDIQNPFFTSVVRAVEDIAYQQQYSVFLCNSDEDPAKETLYIDLMLAEHVAGFIVSPTASHNDAYRRLVEARVPVVAIDRRVADVVDRYRRGGQRERRLQVGGASDRQWVHAHRGRAGNARIEHGGRALSRLCAGAAGALSARAAGAHPHRDPAQQHRARHDVGSARPAGAAVGDFHRQQPAHDRCARAPFTSGAWSFPTTSPWPRSTKWTGCSSSNRR